MPSSLTATIAIPVPIQKKRVLEAFCSTNGNVSSTSLVKLAFATVLYQYFDVTDFTCLEAVPDDHRVGYQITGNRQVRYAPEVASTVAIRDVLSGGLEPLLIDGTARNDATAINGGRVNNNNNKRPRASLVLVKAMSMSADALVSSLSAELVSCPRMSIDFLTGSFAHTPLQNEAGLELCFDEATMSALLLYSPSQIITEFLATNFADTLSTTLSRICSTPPSTLLANLETCSSQTLTTISQWNQFTPAAHHKLLLHELVGQGFAHKPSATAILSWEGAISYSELDHRSSALAAYLLEEYHLVRNQKVALCFEKSTWAVVCMLAVLKAGAAYCCLDPGHPRARHEAIIQKLNAPVILTSQRQAAKFSGQQQQAVPVLVPTASHEGKNPYRRGDVLVSPEDTCIVAFTSGSTGMPKGIVHTHNSLVTGIVSNAPRQHLAEEGVSTYQWSSYTFDVSMTEIYAPLIYGGCICIPSDEERLNNVEESMNRMGANWAYFTPSFARLFAGYSLPSLKTLLMGGEVVRSEDVDEWNNGKGVRIIHCRSPRFSFILLLARYLYGNVYTPFRPPLSLLTTPSIWPRRIRHLLPPRIPSQPALS